MDDLKQRRLIGTVKVDLASFGTNKPPIAEGTEVVLISSHWIHHVEVEKADGTAFRTDIPSRLLRIECEHPDCAEEATMDAPHFWCRPHWQEWFSFPEGSEPDWMKGTDDV